MERVDLAVVGAGPAGLAAASAAAATGLQVAVLDESPAVGGQYLAHPPGTGFTPRTPTEATGAALLDCLPEMSIDVRLGTLVWGIRRDDNAYLLALSRSSDGGAPAQALAARTVVLAPGARERVLPFPGWTLPGVWTAGGAGRLARSHGVVPGSRILVAGSGPLLLPVAVDLLEAGADLAGVLEATGPRQWAGHAGALLGQWHRLGEGRDFYRALRDAGVPYRLGRTVVRAVGRGGVRSAIVAKLDGSGRPVRGTAETWAVDAVCVGFGLVANTELARLAGCAFEYRRDLGGWVPRTDGRMETSLAGVFAAGEAAGVAGAEAAILEGRVAGLAVASRLKKIREPDWKGEMENLRKHQRADRRFVKALNTLFVPPEGSSVMVRDDTVVCRCEDVTAGEVRAAAAAGAGDLSAVKNRCRVGQGLCQGRTCGDTVARILAESSGKSEEAAGEYRVRPPLKPVSLGALSALDVPALGIETEADVPPALPRVPGRPRALGRADVVVVGGGIVGAGCAYALSGEGLSVTLVERSRVAGGSSGACDGILLLWDKQPGPELELGRTSTALWRELAEELGRDFEYLQRGTLMVADSEEALEGARKTAERMTGAGVPNEFVDPQRILELEPHLARDLAGGFFFPDDAQLDPRKATLALLDAARARGLSVYTGTEALGLLRDGSGAVAGVETPAGRFDAGAVVDAAGVWSGALLREVGVSVPVRPRKGHVLVTGRVPGLLQRPVMEGGYVGTVGSASEGVQVALVAEPTASGTVLLGSSREFAGFDDGVALEVMAAIARRTLRFIPGLATRPVIRSYAGFRPWSPDHLPFIGPVSGVPGLYLATGHEGAGICLAPVTGRIVADWILGRVPRPPADRVLPGRAPGS